MALPTPDPAAQSSDSDSEAGTGAGSHLTTSVYNTRLGPGMLSWSRSLLGLSLSLSLSLSLRFGPSSLSFRIRPWLLWRRRGSKRLHFGPSLSHCAHVYWDLTRARFGLSPEPLSGFFVSLSVNGELALVAGDLADEAYRAARAQRPICISGLKPSVLVSRIEHVRMEMGQASNSNCCHRSRVRVWGREMDVCIRLVGKEKGELGFCIAIDGKHILQVKRLRWKFRGSEKVTLQSEAVAHSYGDKVQVSWDLHNWIFPSRGSQTPALVDVDADAVFMLKFEKDCGFDLDVEEEEEEEGKGKGTGTGTMTLGRLIGAGAGAKYSSEMSGACKRKSRLRKTGSGSSSTSSTASSSSGSTIMDWSSTEEVQLRRAEGFSLLLYASKT